jgi:hypothetical protein
MMSLPTTERSGSGCRAQTVEGNVPDNLTTIDDTDAKSAAVRLAMAIAENAARHAADLEYEAAFNAAFGRAYRLALKATER